MKKLSILGIIGGALLTVAPFSQEDMVSGQ
jgi:hypothetical protein